MFRKLIPLLVLCCVPFTSMAFDRSDILDAHRHYNNVIESRAVQTFSGKSVDPSYHTPPNGAVCGTPYGQVVCVWYDDFWEAEFDEVGLHAAYQKSNGTWSTLSFPAIYVPTLESMTAAEIDEAFSIIVASLNDDIADKFASVVVIPSEGKGRFKWLAENRLVFVGDTLSVSSSAVQ